MEPRVGVEAVNGHRLHWVSQGEPTHRPIILLHSGLGSERDWRELAAPLADLGHHVITYDRWGYGHSDRREGFAPPGFTEDSSDLHCLMEAWSVGQAALIGHSDGGSIALAYAARQPDRVSCVIAVAAHAYVELKTRAGIRALQRSFESDPDVGEALGRRHGERTADIAGDWFAGWQRREAWMWDMRDELTAVRCPALIVQGLDDAFATPDHARDIAAAVTDAELVLLDGVGHMLPQEEPERFLELVRSFLGSCGRRAVSQD